MSTPCSARPGCSWPVTARRSYESTTRHRRRRQPDRAWSRAGPGPGRGAARRADRAGLVQSALPGGADGRDRGGGAVHRRQPGRRLILREGLREYGVGSLAGTHADEREALEPVFAAWAAGDDDAAIPGGERVGDIVARMAAVLEEVADLTPARRCSWSATAARSWPRSRSWSGAACGGVRPHTAERRARRPGGGRRRLAPRPLRRGAGLTAGRAASRAPHCCHEQGDRGRRRGRGADLRRAAAGGRAPGGRGRPRPAPGDDLGRRRRPVVPLPRPAAGPGDRLVGVDVRRPGGPRRPAGAGRDPRGRRPDGQRHRAPA